MACNPQPGPLVLASASPRRRELLTALGVPIDVRPAAVDETPPAGVTPEQAVRLIADRKALAAAGNGQGIVLTADTIVVLEGRILGKPEDEAAARVMLDTLAGREHEVITAVALATPADRRVESVRTGVLVRRYTPAEVEASIAAGTPFDKAGGYAIQDSLLQPVERCDGCYCNVVGLPLWTVYGMVRGLFPITSPAAVFARCAACPLRPDAA